MLFARRKQYFARIFDNKFISAMIKKIGKTTYKVHVHLSNTSTETMSDKIKRVFKMKFIRYRSGIPVSILPESWFLKAGIFNRGLFSSPLR